LYLHSRSFKFHLRTRWMTNVRGCLTGPALWRSALWLSPRLAVVGLALGSSLTLSAPQSGNQQPAAPASLTARAPGSAAPQAPPTKPPTAQAPQSPSGGPPGSQNSPGTPPTGTQPAAAESTAPASQQPQPGGQTPSAGQAAPTGPSSVLGGPGVGFRLENADLIQFINLVAGELKLNYVLDPAVKGVVTISTSGELKPADLFPILETVLKMNGATAVKVGNLYRIIPLVAAPKNPLGVSTSGAVLPSDDRMMMQIIPLKFVFADDMSKMLAPFLSEGGQVTVLSAANTLILVDDSLNVKRLMDILHEFDNSSFDTQRVRLIPVHNNVASALGPELETIFATYAQSEKQTPLRFVPLDRINAILVAAADPGAFTEVERWIAKLDEPAPTDGIQTFVYRVQYSEADRLLKLLGALMGTSGSAGAQAVSSEHAKGAGQGGTGLSSLQESNFQQSARGNAASTEPFSSAGTPESATGPDSKLRIITDPVSNSIVVQGTAQQYAEIARTLDKLDIVPRQVMIEARVYEVDITGDLSFGLEYALEKRGTAAASSSTPTGLQFSGGTTGSSGGLGLSVGGVIGSTRELMSFLTASENRTRVRTLSAPTLITTDSTQARIQVGQSVPTLSSQGLAAGGQIAGSSLFTSTVNNVDTGIILTVTPRITSTGLVSLQINQEISNEVPPATSSTIQSPSFTKRSVSTHAVAQDGQTIALGGLISYSYNRTTNRIPLLGDIPWVGALFGSTSYNTQETELIVLLTARIISTLPGATAATHELEEKLRDLRREFKKDEMLKQ
jgi:general secretion pathway protein D